MPVTNTGTNPLHVVYNRWERFLNDVSRTVGGDRELGELSNKVGDLKKKAFADGQLSAQELEGLYANMELIAKAYEKVAADRGYPVGKTLPTTKEGFKVYGENAQIHFGVFAGDEIKDGKIGGLLANPKQNVKALAMDLVASASPEVAEAKVSLLRGALSQLSRADQLAVMGQVKSELEGLTANLRTARALPISPARFAEVSKFEATASVHKTTLPDSVKGTNQMFPNKPVPGWEKSVREATKAGFDDMQQAGKLFIDKIPAGATKTVAVKLDMNLGREGTPSVSDPASTAATVHELLSRADKDGKTLHLNVGDSCGGENIPMGRTTMDIMRDTGNYHMALKAGLEFAVSKGGAGAADAAAALAKINAAEARGVYFGSKEDNATKADLDAAEKAAKPWVTCVDYDVAGYVPVTPDLPPHGLAAWGTKEFQMAKPWVESDFRVHVARGLSTHTLAAWTGALKGLIGVHGFGLRPADQSGDKMGQSPINLFGVLGTATGFLATISQRHGVPDLLARIMTGGDQEQIEQAKKLESRWGQLMSDGRAGKHFKAETLKLQDVLKEDQKNGMPPVILFEKMRQETRKILEQCDKMSPGFTQHYWQTTHDATRFAMQNLTREPFRSIAIPAVTRDEQLGSRIGLLTHLPYQSDLVVQSQAKIGVGGGPDAYREVRDVGHVAVGTDEASLDAIAWQAANQPGSMFELNFPLMHALRLGHAPMHIDEIKRLD